MIEIDSPAALRDNLRTQLAEDNKTIEKLRADLAESNKLLEKAREALDYAQSVISNEQERKVVLDVLKSVQDHLRGISPPNESQQQAS